MTTTMSLRVLASSAVLAGAFLVAPFAFAQEAAITSISTGDATPSIEGTASDVESVDLSITQDDSEVYSSDDIAVADGAWSHDVADELANGDYVAIVSASSTELASTSFTVNVGDDSADDDGDETVEERLKRMEAFIAKLQALITKLTTLRERVGSRAMGPVKNPHLKSDDDEDDDDDDSDDDDWKGNSGKNEKVCHNGKTKSVGPANVAAHLAHGDTEGRCDDDDEMDEDESEDDDDSDDDSDDDDSDDSDDDSDDDDTDDDDDDDDGDDD